ncbi:MAG: hypothetical protein ACI4MQ_01975 [Candidatus Coproplasma sp.]
MAENKRENECKTYLRITADERYLDNIMGCISKFTPCKREKNCVVAGVCESYDVDVNVMIRQTIKGLLGNEEELLSLQQNFSAEIYLVVVPQIVAEGEEPNQILSLESDIIEFLYKSKVKYDLDYYVL